MDVNLGFSYDGCDVYLSIYLIGGDRMGVTCFSCLHSLLIDTYICDSVCGDDGCHRICVVSYFWHRIECRNVLVVGYFPVVMIRRPMLSSVGNLILHSILLNNTLTIKVCCE